jgi:cytochrome c2
MPDADHLLLSVGDFGFNGIASRQLFSQDGTVDYGKILEIDLRTRKSSVYSLGIRNPQGLHLAADGTLWETEHGPQGGDELNRIRRGANYGWPVVTYGVDYGTFAWPLNPRQGDHVGFEAPFYAWMPSVGISDLTSVSSALFPLWRDDLLVTSLAGQTVFRVRVRNDRVAYVEPLAVGNRRQRDIREAPDGRIVLWADDDDALVTLRPVTGTSGEILFATNCSGCHKVGDGTSHRIGPDLWGVVGRPVATAPSFVGYSPGLKSLGGRWSEERLDDFLAHPQQTVPGTAMEFPGLPDADARRQIVDYLKSAPKVTLQ